MAKKQGLQSIMGQADTTLVNAAYRMGMANVPKDLSGIHNKMGDAFAAGMQKMGAGFGALAGAAINKGIELAEKAKEDEDNNALGGFKNDGNDSFGNKVKGFFGKIGDFVEDVFDGGGIGGKAPIEKGDNDTENDTKSYSDEYTLKNSNGNETIVKSMSLEENMEDIRIGIGQVRKDFKDGTITKQEKREKIEALKERRETAKRSAVSFSTTKAIIDDHLKNGNFNNSPSNMKYADFLKAIQANGEPDAKTGNKAIQGFDDQGNMMFSYVNSKGELIKDEYGNNISITSGQAKNLITTVYDKGRTVIEEIGINSDKNGSTAAWTTNDDAATKHKVNTIVGNDVNNFNDLKAYPVRGVVGGKESTATLEGYLNGADLSASDLTDQMWSVLSQDSSLLAKIGVEDKNNDGLDKGDFATPENMKKLVDAVIRHDNPGFNLQTSKSILAEFVNSQAKSLHDNKWNASPLNKNSANFVTPPGKTPGTEKEREAANRINTFNSVFKEGGGTVPLGSGDELNIINRNGTYTIERTFVKDGETDPQTQNISIDKAYELISKNDGRRAIDVFGSDIYNKFGNVGLNLSKIKLPTDDNEMMGALKQLTFPGKENFSYDTDMLDGNNINIKYVDPKDKSNVIEKTFKTSDKVGIEDFLNNPDPLNPNT